MGNEFSEENETKEEKPIDKSDSFIKYGIISKKWEESSIQDSFLAFSDLQSSEESKNKIHFGLYGVFESYSSDIEPRQHSPNACLKFFWYFSNCLLYSTCSFFFCRLLFSFLI